MRAKNTAGEPAPARRGPRSLSLTGSLLLFVFTIPVLLLQSGCSANPATGKQQLNFYSEAQEIETGRKAAAEVAGQMPALENPELQAYVSGLGAKLAATSERPGLPWTFQVVDDPAVNAFALPGGFVYVTRGLLGTVTSEAELAAVMGHEIGHVTAQHGMNQMSKQQMAMGGLLVGAIVSPEVAQAADLVETGLSLLFLKYSRDDERQADDLGLRYLARARYEASEMPAVYSALEQVSQIEGGGRLPGWLSTHPDPGARRERSERLIAERRYKPGEIGGEAYLRRLDGLAYGPDPRQGYFDGQAFYHPEMAFRVEIPAGWQAVNEARRMIAAHPDGVAQVVLTLAAAKSADEAARGFLAQGGVQTIGSRRARLNGLAAVQADFSVQGQRAISGRAAFVEKGGRVFQLVGLVYSDRAGSVRGGFDTFLGSFATLKDPKRLNVQVQRLRVVELPRAMTFEEFERANPADADPRLAALINRIDDPARTLPAGTLLKRIEGKKAGPQAIGIQPR